MISLKFHIASNFSGSIGFSGVPLRAAFLSLLQKHDEELSGKVHDSPRIRSYALEPLPFGSRFRTHFEEGEVYDFGVNLFNADGFENAVRSIALNPKSKLRLHHHYFPVKRIDFANHNPSKLAEDWTTGVSDHNGRIEIGVKFMTPTQFSQFGSDKAYLLPSPEKIFPALLRVWNSIKGTTAVDRISDYYQWVEQNLYVTAHRIRTVKVSLGRNRSVIGFIGNAKYAVEGSDDPFIPLTVCLARFAEMSNVGKNRTAGLGKVKVEIDGIDNG